MKHSLRNEIWRIARRGIEDALRPLGFNKPSGFADAEEAFSKPNDDVIWFVAACRLPRETDHVLDLGLEFCVYSPKMEMMSDPTPWTRSWASSQLRASLADIAPGAPAGLSFDTADDAAQAVQQIQGWILNYGVPFLERFPSTESMLPLLESDDNRFALSGLERRRWEAAVWRGEIDPVKEPFISPVKGPTKEFHSVRELIEWQQSQREANE